jgi:uncharacterized protein YlxW (UPF0749 family)
MNPFANRRESTNRWVLPMSLLTLTSGMLLSMAFLSDGGNKVLPPEFRGNSVANLDLAAELQEVKDEVAKLRVEKTALETKLAEQGNASKEINDSLQETKVFAGLTPLQGEGLIVTLTDSKKSVDDFIVADAAIVHYLDVLKSVNELFNAGAEAIAVNGLRVGPRTDLRCVGTTIMVDAQKIAPPITIQAIGDSKTLLGAMNMPGGILEELRSVDPAMVRVEAAKELLLPAFDGSATFKIAKVPEVKK